MVYVTKGMARSFHLQISHVRMQNVLGYLYIKNVHYDLSVNHQ